MALVGEPGIGKTLLLNSIANQPDMLVVRCDGYEAESSIAHAGLQRMGQPLAGYLGGLTESHRQALRVAWGTEEGPAPDRFLVGMAMLSLLAAAGSARPVLCLVDDAQWLDSESLGVLAFVARRLQAESAVLVLAARAGGDIDKQLAGIATIRLQGLDGPSAVALLQRTAPDIVDPLVATTIVAATEGNPLALVELAGELSTRGHADPSSHDLIPIGRRLEEHYLREVSALPSQVQRWLALAAVANGGDRRLIDLACAEMGLPAECATEAARAGLVSRGEHVSFRHPLVRSAVYAATPGAQRREIHTELARAAERLGLPDVEAWHSAEAATGLDAAVAARLEASAARAARRGGRLSEARLLARAAELTPPGAQRNGRLLAAAEAAAEAGAAPLASQYLDRVDADHLDAVHHGRLTATRTALALFLADPAVIVRAAADMICAADSFRDVDTAREHQALLKAFQFVLVSEGMTDGTSLSALGRRIDAGASTATGLSATLLRAIAALILRPYDQAVPLLHAALDALLDLDDQPLLEYGFLGSIFGIALFDAEATQRYLNRVAEVARDRAALRVLDSALWVRSLFEIDRGNPAAATAYVDRVRELRRASGYEAENVINVSCLIWAGMPAEEAEAISDAILQAGFGGVCTSAKLALAIREIAQGRYADAYARLTPLVGQRFIQVTDHMLADYVEAAVRSGHTGQAREAAERITELAEASGTNWIRGLDERCKALLADGVDAESHYRRAEEVLSDGTAPCELGRAHLLYGEWLRRRRRRRDAREKLTAAARIFEQVGAPAFLDRARAELAATGERLDDRALVAGIEMSPREAAVARMAAGGSTNAEIAATLFISTNTVDYHLRKVFAKLQITSRRQLTERFDPAD